MFGRKREAGLEARKQKKKLKTRCARHVIYESRAPGTGHDQKRRGESPFCLSLYTATLFAVLRTHTQ